MSRCIHLKTFDIGQCLVNVIAFLPFFGASVYCTGDGQVTEYLCIGRLVHAAGMHAEVVGT